MAYLFECSYSNADLNNCESTVQHNTGTSDWQQSSYSL